MRAVCEWAPSQVKEVPNGQWNDHLREPRIGVMLHYDGSMSDAGAVSWFGHPQCRVSYHLLVLDDGSYVRIAPDTARAWHAGVCRPSSDRLDYRDANSAFFGIAAATTSGVDVTPLQLLTIAFLVRRWFDLMEWPVTDTWRIVSHRSEAWPRGRKTDPEGGHLKNPIYSPDDVRSLIGRVRMAA